ncbi:MAG: ABC transporter ATP-binding protein [Planctomycetaceae bacterium]
MTDSVIHIQSLSRRFRNKQALDNVTLNVPKGSVFGLVGENGAGKTTLLKHVLGLLKASQGSVRVLDMDPVADPAAVLSRIGYLSESREMPDWMKIQEYMHFQASFYPDWDHKYAAELVLMFELQTGQKIRTLSRGQLARVGLLVAIAHRPELLILDEPSSGLDPVVRRDILAAIIRTVADEGRTVLFSSHLLDEVQRVSDHVAMLHQGRLLLSNPLEQVLEQHSRWTIRLAQAVTDMPVIPGTISCHGSGQELSVICNGQHPEMQKWVSECGAQILDRATPTLEEIFVARVTPAMPAQQSV